VTPLSSSGSVETLANAGNKPLRITTSLSNRVSVTKLALALDLLVVVGAAVVGDPVVSDPVGGDPVGGAC